MTVLTGHWRGELFHQGAYVEGGDDDGDETATSSVTAVDRSIYSMVYHLDVSTSTRKHQLVGGVISGCDRSIQE